MTDVINFASIRTARRDFGLEDRIRAKRARMAEAEAAIKRQALIRHQARLVLADVLREPVDPASAS